LHSYPDWFRLHVTKWHGFRQIGNSVPPRLARAVASKVLEALNLSPARLDRPISLGSPELLSFDMSQAAARYDVPVDVVPKRKRIAPEAFASV